MNVPVTAAILAGGQASRLGGRDKIALRVGSVTILERQVAVLHEVAAAIVLVTTERTPPGVSGLRVATDRMRG
ncbi:MAG: NTP transferase domain-containing protein, partial [Acidobacteria bacterium]|nr:NTP transferase domain-containing protein [Acidobacteriota bacterium]